MRSTDFSRWLAQAVRQHRKRAGLTQEQLAERADLAPEMISLVERAGRNPSVNVGDSIAQGLGMPFWRLVKTAEELGSRKRERRPALPP